MRILSCTGSILLIILFIQIEANSTPVKQDFQNLLTWQNTAIISLGIGLAGITHRWDDNLDRQAHRLPVFKVTADPSNIYGSSTFNLPATLGFYLFSKAIKRPGLQAVSSDLLRALLWTQTLVGPVKHATRRNRPDGSNQLSFPSGHTANAFAIAGVMNAHYGARIGVPFYAWSMLVGGARLEGHRHFLSDVVAGAAFGIVVGRVVSHTTSTDKIALFPTPIPGGMGLTLMFKR